MKHNNFLVIIFIISSIFTIQKTYSQQQLVQCPITTPQPIVAYANCSFVNALLIDWKPIQTQFFVSNLILSSVTNLNLNLAQTLRQVNLIENLRTLDLSSNSLNENLNGNDLMILDCSFSFLKTIIFSYNSFTRIPVLNKTCSHCIESLYMNNNPNLVDFDRLFNTNTVNFNNMTALKHLDVSNCMIQIVNGNSQSILMYMPNLVSLNLRNNRIKQIYESPFIWAPNFMYFNMDGNLLDCNYSSLWFKYYLLNTNTSYLQLTNSVPYDLFAYNRSSYAPLCSYTLLMMNTTLDPALTRIKITNLDDNLFYTDVFLSTNLTTVVYNLNTNDYIDLNCQVYSIPESEITWTLNQRELSRITNNVGDPYLFFDSIVPTTRSLRLPKGNRVITKNATKSSTLRILKINTTYQGVYECRTSYTIDVIRNLMTKNLFFTLNVKPLAENTLSTGDIVGIVFACIIALLLLLILLALLVYFLCYKRKLCCFKENNNQKLYKNSSSNSSASKYIGNGNDFNSGGFQDDIAYTKPNYLTYPGQINEHFYNQNSNTTTTTNTITDSSLKSMTNLPSQQQNFRNELNGMGGNFNSVYNNNVDDDDDNVYNVNNQQVKYHINQQPHHSDEFDTLYSINTNTISLPQQLHQQELETHRVLPQIKPEISTLNNGIYFPQQHYNTEMDVDNSNFEDFYEQYYINKSPQHQQQQQRQFNNNFLKYDSDV